MPFVESRLISPITLTTSASSALYTVPTGYSAIIKQLVVTNITGTAATFTFYIGAASAGNALFSGTSVAANDTVIINLSQVLTTGEVLRALASTGSALNLTVSGVINDGPLASTATVIVDNAITVNKIASGAVTSVKLADSLALTGAPTAPTATAGTNTTQLATTEFVTSGMPTRNLLYNGAMQIAQRADTSASNLTTGGYLTADRWLLNIYNTGGWTQSLVTDVPTAQGFRTAWKATCDTALVTPLTNAYLICEQKLEGFDCQRLMKGTANAQSLTVQFWVKSSTVGTYIFELRDADNSRAISKSYTINVANTWEQKIITIPADATGTLNNDNGESLCFSWWLAAGADYKSGTLATNWASLTTANRTVGQTTLSATVGNNWLITGVQVTVGTPAVALPYEFKPYGTELAQCQRYYWREQVGRHGQTGTTYILDNIIGAACDQSAWVRYPVRNPVIMRALPTVVYSNTTANFTNLTATGGNVSSSLGALACSFYAINLYIYSAGISTGTAACLRMNNANAFFGADAELV